MKSNIDREIVECLSCGLYYGCKRIPSESCNCPGCGLPFIAEGFGKVDCKDIFSKVRENSYQKIMSTGKWVR